MVSKVDERKNLIYLSLGANLGNRKETLKKAVSVLQHRVGKVVALSSLYESEAWGNEDLNAFYNIAVGVESALLPSELLRQTQTIELELGRTMKTKGESYQNRAIDIDVLFYGEQIVQEENLTIPHPLLQERNFVLEPLNEIAPTLVHPQFNQTISELLKGTKDTLRCKKVLN